MARLSALAQLVFEGDLENRLREHMDLAEPQVDPLDPVSEGFTRGAMGSMGSRGLQSRNSDAGLEEERERINSPVMQSFLDQTTVT